MRNFLAKIRRPNQQDVPRIKEISEEYKDNPLPTRFECAAIVERNDKIVAFGVLRSDIEAILYCSGSDRDKVESLVKMVSQAIDDAKAMGHDSIYTFAQDEKFAAILERLFSFKRIKNIPMILDLE